MYKQVIVIRKDLHLSKGKMSSQVAHASLSAYNKADKKIKTFWEREGAKKVVVGVKNLSELLGIQRKAIKLGLPCSLIRDAGRTHIKKGTVTCIGIGPDKEEKIDSITKELKLL